jgi:hypothetical protein
VTIRFAVGLGRFFGPLVDLAAIDHYVMSVPLTVDLDLAERN